MAVTCGDRHNLGPAIRHQRLGRWCLDQLDRGRVQQADGFEESLLAHAANHQGDTGGADVGRFGDDIRHRQQRPIIMALEFIDLVLAPPHRCIGVHHGFGVDQTQFHRLRCRKDLESRAEFIDPLYCAVEQRAVRRQTGQRRLRAVIRIEIRQAGKGDDLAGLHLHQNGRRTFGIHHFHAGAKHFFDCRLNRQIKRQCQGRTRRGWVTQTGVQRLFNAGSADHFGAVHSLGPERSAAQHMRGQRSIRIKPHLTRAEQQTGVADFVHHLHLFRAQHPADPHERPPVGKAPFQRCRVQIGENLCKLRGHRLGVHHVFGLHIQRMGQHVGRQQPPVAVGDIGAAGQDRGPMRGRAGFHRFRRR